MKRPIILVLLLLALGIAVWWTKGFGLFDSDNAQGRLVLNGNVEVREVQMAFRVPGRVKDVLVEEGDRVAPGTVLAVLDTGPVEDRIRQADAQIAQARANLARLANGSRTQEVAVARARVDAAQARLDDLASDVARREPLAQAGAISRNAWEDTQSAYRTAQAQAREARAALSLQREGARSEDIAAARAALAAAEAARASIATDLGDTRLEAAGEGLVVTRAAEPGSLVQPGQTVVTVSIDRPMRIRAYVAESDLSRIAPGMEVEILADGGGRPITGRIGFISPRAEFTPKTVETQDLRTDLVYQVRIIAEDSERMLRQGQPVSVYIAAPAKAD